MTHEFIIRELCENRIEQAYSIRSAMVVISDIVDQFIANDHNDAKVEYERLRDPNSWLAPRNVATLCFLEVRRL